MSSAGVVVLGTVLTTDLAMQWQYKSVECDVLTGPQNNPGLSLSMLSEMQKCLMPGDWRSSGTMAELQGQKSHRLVNPETSRVADTFREREKAGFRALNPRKTSICGLPLSSLPYRAPGDCAGEVKTMDGRPGILTLNQHMLCLPQNSRCLHTVPSPYPGMKTQSKGSQQVAHQLGLHAELPGPCFKPLIPIPVSLFLPPITEPQVAV